MQEQNIEKKIRAKFSKALLKWNREVNDRSMPWKGERDPYKIWLSEIILQQTRVEQGWSYYERFAKTFPTIKDLAAAPEQQVFKLWEGLGYYSRCRNLIATAKYIAEEYKGVFPKTYEEILSLKGVGPYTAAAIASFAYNLPYSVLDGNVFRVLSRILDIETPIDTTEGKNLFSGVAQNILPKKEAGEYNQALMDFGATVCKPLPECAHCFFKKDCQAFSLHKQQALPVKEKKMVIKERWLNYFVLRHKKKIAICERREKDVWQNLYEFLLLETDRKPNIKNLFAQLEKNYAISKTDFNIVKEAQLSQRLSHQLIHFIFITLELSEERQIDDMYWVDSNNLEQYPLPKTLQSLLQKQQV
ncbi:MAG: A/G-specific adenine glycosylase [Chitinophagaceae bacterium]